MNSFLHKEIKKGIAWLTVCLFTLQPVMAVAQAIADPNASQQNRPIIESANNGTPVVQIATPSAAGVSRNFYQQFDIDSKGLILNNSLGISKTQLAGYIQGNSHLGNTPARVILNEVTGSNVSNLKGYLEVAGQKAGVIIANPNGIIGDGFGFINTSRAVLTTGSPIFGGSGSLDAFRVTGGQIIVQGNGIDATTTDKVDLLSRAVAVNSGIWAKELNVVTGNNNVNYETLQAETLEGDVNTPSVAIDVSSLGGMYANKIKLIGNEHGVGVNSQGTISANGGDIVITNDGKIMLAGTTNASGNITVKADNDLTNKGTIYAKGNTNVNSSGALNNTGLVAAAKNAEISAHEVSSTGTIGAGIQSDGSIGINGNLAITSDGNLMVHGQNLAAGDLSIQAASVNLYGSSTSAGNSINLTTTSGDINNIGSSLQAGGVLTVSAAGALHNDINVSGSETQIQANQIKIAADKVTNHGGKMIQYGKESTSIVANHEIDNTGGQIATNAMLLQIKADSFNNDQGQIQHSGTGSLSIQTTSDLINNSGKILSNGQINLQTKNLNTTKGTISAQKSLEITTDGLINSQGAIGSNDAIKITAQGKITNDQNGIIEAQNTLNITAQSLNNDNGDIRSLGSGAATITSEQQVSNQSGLIASNGDLNITARNLSNNIGQLTSQGNLSINTTQDTDNTDGKIAAQQDVTLINSNLKNQQGIVQSGNHLKLKAVDVNNTSGSLAAGSDVHFNIEKLDGGSITAGRDINFTSDGNMLLGTFSEIKANRNVNISAGSSVTNQGKITAVQDINLSGSNITNEKSGNVVAGVGLKLNATNNIVNSGLISSGIGTTSNISGRTVTNLGTIFADNLKIQGNSIYNIGSEATIAATGNTNLYALTSIENKQGANIFSGKDINVAGSQSKDLDGNYIHESNIFVNDSSTIQAIGNINISANQVNNISQYNTESHTVSDERYDQEGVNALPVSRENWYEINPHNTTARLYKAGYKQTHYGTMMSEGIWLIDKAVTDSSVTNIVACGKILSGANMKIHGKGLTNDMGQILANGKIEISMPDGTVNNIAHANVRTTTQTFIWTPFLLEWSWGTHGNGFGYSMRVSDPVLPVELDTRYGYAWLTSYYGHQTRSSRWIGQSYKDITTEQLNGSQSGIIGGGQLVSIKAANVNNNTVAPGGVSLAPINKISSTIENKNITAAKQANRAEITLPKSGMYSIHTEPSSHYLVETNSRFINLGNFISSDYMLKNLGLEPGMTLKRLGDGFYEQQQVLNQITELTGRQYLYGYSSAKDQFQALMDNGIANANKLNLQVGVTLTDEQKAKLSSDIVWMVEKEVQGQKILVPEVYLAAMHDGNLKPSGALIIADEIKLSTSDLNNSGVIKATNQVEVNANNITNSLGTLDGGKSTQLIVNQDIVNKSGSINGNHVSISAGRDFTNETQIYTKEFPFMTRTTVGDVANINAKENLLIQVGRDINVTGAKINAGKDVNFEIGNQFNIDSVRDHERISVGYYLKDNITNLAGSIEAGHDVNINSNSDVVLHGAQINSGNNLKLQSGGNITISSIKNSETSDVTHGDSSGYDRVMTSDEKVIGSHLSAQGDIAISAKNDGLNDNKNTGNIVLEGSYVNSSNGTITISSDKSLTIQEATEKHEDLHESRHIHHGFFSTKVKETRDYSLDNEVKGSTVSGQQVNFSTGSDLTIKGSNVVGTGNVELMAADNANILSAQENVASDHYRFEKKSGLFSSGGIGFSIGSQSKKNTTEQQGVNQIGSTIGSINGNVSIDAGKDATVKASDIIGSKGVDITGQNIIIESADNTAKIKETYKFTQSGLSISIGNRATEQLGNAINDFKRSTEVEDSRLKSLHDYKGYNEAKDVLKESNVKSGMSVTISLGSSSSKSETNTQITSVQESSVNSNGDVKLKATDGNLTVTGSTINGSNIDLSATKDINLHSEANTNKTETTSSSSSSAIGVKIGLGHDNQGVSPSVQGSKSSGNEQENGITYTQAVVTAQDTLATKSGNDTNIVGAQVRGDTINMNAGNNLNILSQQDTNTYKERSSSSGGTIGIGINISTSKSNIDSSYQSVNEQSGVYAGSGGFDINIAKNTDLKGAVISSEATPDKNKISTDTLTYSDIKNKAEYSASSSGFGVGISKDGKITGGPTPSMPVNGSADSTTKSAISPGTIEIRSNPDQDLSSLSRDPSGALNALGKIFDKESVKEKQELVNLFSQEAVKLVGDIAEREKDRLTHKITTAQTDQEKVAAKNEYKLWMEGGTNKVLLHAFVGGLTGQLASGDFMSGAAGAGFNEVFQRELKNIKDPILHQLASALVGSTAAKILGGDTKTGAITALNGTKYNYLSHWQKEQRDKAVSDEDWNMVAYYDRVDDVQEKTLNKFGLSADFIDSYPEAQNILSKLTTNIMSLQDDGLDPFAVLESLDEASQMFDTAKYGVLIAAGIEFVNLKPLKGIGGKGWRGDKTWKSNVNTVRNGGTIEEVNGTIATQQEAIDLINASGGKIVRIEEAHPEGGLSPHTYPHINYETSSGVKGAIRIQEVIN